MNGCDGCLFEIEHDHGQFPRTFTFGLVYGESYGDELDIIDSDPDTARRTAEKVAGEVYDPGWTEIRSLPRGGSGGWVTIL